MSPAVTGSCCSEATPACCQSDGRTDAPLTRVHQTALISLTISLIPPACFIHTSDVNRRRDGFGCGFSCWLERLWGQIPWKKKTVIVEAPSCDLGLSGAPPLPQSSAFFNLYDNVRIYKKCDFLLSSGPVQWSMKTFNSASTHTRYTRQAGFLRMWQSASDRY